MHMSREAQVSGLLATNCDFEPVVDTRHFAAIQGTSPLSAYIRQPQLEVHAAEKPHYVVNGGCRESGQRCDLLVVEVEFAAFAIRPPTCLGDVSSASLFQSLDTTGCIVFYILRVPEAIDSPSRVSSSLP